MHIMHTVFIILSHDTCIFFCSRRPKIFHNIFLCSKYFSRLPVQECIKVYSNRCLSKEPKGSVKSVMANYKWVKWLWFITEWVTFQQKSEQSLNFLKWPLYWGQQIADGDQTWFVEQILNAQLGLRPTIKTLLKHAILLKTSPTHSMEYWTDPVQNRLLDFGLGLRLKFGINLSNSLIFWRQLLTRPLLKIIIACWNTFKVSTFQRGSKPTFRIGILMCSDAK